MFRFANQLSKVKLLKRNSNEFEIYRVTSIHSTLHRVFYPSIFFLFSALSTLCLFGILLEDKKMTFCRPFLSFGRQKVTKRTAKSRAAFFVLQFGQQPKKDSKKSRRSFWSAKGRPGEKDGKKSWHLRSPIITCKGRTPLPLYNLVLPPY